LASAGSETEENRLLEQRLIYGMYPEIVLSKLEKPKLLHELAGDYLYKDILSLDSVRKPSIIPKLLQALALQITGEVSLTELGETAGCDRNTVIRYLDLLRKTFVIFTLPALARNQRNEIRKTRKVYFWDNYFWRTHQQQEIDLIREKDAVFDAYEFKWSPSKKVKIPESFSKEYKVGSFMEIHRKNYPAVLL
jgi:hypothetical protein